MTFCKKSLQPKDLFSITLDFIAENAENIHCLVGFPDIVGKRIFDRFIHLSDFAVLASKNQVKIISCFAMAYNKLILESVALSESLIMLNEFFDSFTILFKYVSEICLCSCYLGDNHEFFELIKDLYLLNKLCLKGNCLRDGAIRKLTLPIRMFDRGPKNIEYLDLSDNALTDAVTPWLATFKKLQCLDLSGSNISIESLQILEKECSLKLCNSENSMHPIITKGWATPLIHKWINVCKMRRESRNIKKRNLYFPKRRLLLVEESLSNTLNTRISRSPILVLKRMPSNVGNYIESDVPVNVTESLPTNTV
ncbi:leucine-rich repeat-containing protein 42 [Nephila pilipes]|uniref:Leucine-rich repeat-containing protein 42 n=1 Tax=Nephila pilipes TaxID=299642 RepID=A0A8X6UAP1_NEPPI|nr:leucine-rich repeat-containing protein 42 [Nephila pilipes]